MVLAVAPVVVGEEEVVVVVVVVVEVVVEEGEVAASLGPSEPRRPCRWIRMAVCPAVARLALAWEASRRMEPVFHHDTGIAEACQRV